jgi:8-oxo-dGTP pyrophosphatase MutT (NUDIX family)
MFHKSASPPNPLPAATVILARQHQAELQVYLLKRHAGSGFMAGHYVFPGGILDPEDWQYSFWQRHVDLDAQNLCNRLGGGSLSAEQIVAYGVAAIRETLEEAGVFFAKRVNQSRTDIEHAVRLRDQKDLPPDWFANLAKSQGWTLLLSALSPWSHWITPVRMKRRYDTRFWLACMPSDQQCRPDQLETTHGLWINPKEGLSGNLSGQIPLSPPTLVTLQQLLAFDSLADLKAEMLQRTWGEPIFPRMLPLDRGAILIEPWDGAYGQSDIDIEVAGLEEAVLPAGEPFSRIWYHEGLYRPVSA